MEAWTTR